MADEPKVAVVYELTNFADTQGREVVRLAPVGGGEGVRFRGNAALRFPNGQIQVNFEIQAGSLEEAFGKYDGRVEEERAKLETEMRKAALMAGSPKIDDFRRNRISRFGGGNGG